MNIIEKIKALLGLLDQIDVHEKDPLGDTALSKAVGQDSEEVAELLIKKGADVNEAGFMGISPLMKAARNHNVSLTRTLIGEGADVNYNDKESFGTPSTALMQAAEVNAVDVAQMLIDNNAKLDAPHQQVGMTALMFAAKNNALETADLLLRSGAKLEAKTFGLAGAGKTAVCYAVIENHKEMVELLLKNGAKTKPLRSIKRQDIPPVMVKWLKAKRAL